MAGEFKGDFTRDTYHHQKHFSRVFQQQGRVQLEADWNEQAAILLGFLRILGADVTAGFASVDGGFVLRLLVQAGGPPPGDFVISPGHCYVDGILCVMEGTPVPFAPISDPKAPTFYSQVRVSDWWTDCMPFQQNQFLALKDANFSTTSVPPYVQAQITNADPKTRTLTLTPPFDVNALTDPPSMTLHRLTTFNTQPDFPLTADQNLAALPQSPNPTLVYLDVWERHIAFNQDPEIREIALGGPDTATRARVVAQVKIDTNLVSSKANIESSLSDIRKVLVDQFQPHNRGWLQARLKPPTDASPLDPCTTHPDARYRGAENQLYRVEVHASGTAAPGTPASGLATFKWSRENASVTFPIISISGQDVSLESLGRDARFSLKVDDWVEILDDILILQGQPGPLFQVAEIDIPDRSITLKSPNAATPPPMAPNDPKHPHPFLRRWDHQDATGAGIPIVEVSTAPNWIDLEDGIQVQFQPALSPASAASVGATPPPPSNQYRSGDYWLLPARTAANGIIEWPVTQDDVTKTAVAIALPPHGVDHHYVPLGWIFSDGKGTIRIDPPVSVLVPTLIPNLK